MRVKSPSLWWSSLDCSEHGISTKLEEQTWRPLETSGDHRRVRGFQKYGQAFRWKRPFLWQKLNFLWRPFGAVARELGFGVMGSKSAGDLWSKQRFRAATVETSKMVVVDFFDIQKWCAMCLCHHVQCYTQHNVGIDYIDYIPQKKHEESWRMTRTMGAEVVVFNSNEYCHWWDNFLYTMTCTIGFELSWGFPILFDIFDKP